MMRPSYFRVFALYLLVFMLTIIWLPEPLAAVRPLWVLLLLLFIQVSVPSVFEVSLVLILGLLLDVLCPTLLGAHAFAFILAAFCLSKRAMRFKFFSMPQQMAWVLGLSLIYQCVLGVVAHFMGYAMPLPNILLPVVTSTLMWPWVKYMLDHVFHLSTRHN